LLTKIIYIPNECTDSITGFAAVAISRHVI